MKLLLGIDLQDVRKFRRIVESGGENFLRKVFTEREVGYCFKFKDPLPHLAARFSAKEAFIKALKSILGERSLDWRDVEVSSKDGKPTFNFSERVKEMLEELGISDVELSLSHSGNYALAAVVLLRYHRGENG